MERSTTTAAAPSTTPSTKPARRRQSAAAFGSTTRKEEGAPKGAPTRRRSFNVAAYANPNHHIKDDTTASVLGLPRVEEHPPVATPAKVKATAPRSFTEIARSEEALAAQTRALEAALQEAQVAAATEAAAATATTTALQTTLESKVKELEAQAQRAVEHIKEREQAQARLQALRHERDSLAEALEGAGVDPIALVPLQPGAAVAVTAAAAVARDARSAQLRALLDAATTRAQGSHALLERLTTLVGTQRERTAGLSTMVMGAA